MLEALSAPSLPGWWVLQQKEIRIKTPPKRFKLMKTVFPLTLLLLSETHTKDLEEEGSAD